MNYQMTEEEKQFLKQYDITKYDQPSVTVDIAVFAVTPGRESETDRDYRKETPLELSLLLIRRGGYPYKDWWALPGGFTHPGDSLEECARREVFEETGLVCGGLTFLTTLSGREFYYEYPNGDTVYAAAVIFICFDYSGDMKVQEDEVVEQRFFSIDALPSDTDPRKRVLYDRVRDYIKSSL